MITALLITIVVLGGSIGDIFVTKGMKEVGEVSTLNVGALLRIAGRTLSNRWFLIGLGCMAVNYVAFLAALSWADLSLVLPATSLGFVVSALGARVYLNERISPLRWTGIVLICAGVALVGVPTP